MKHLFFKMVIAGALIMLTFSSCKKSDTYPDLSNRTTSQLPVVMNLTTSHWEAEADGVLVNTFKNIVPANATYVNVFLESSGTEIIDHPVRWQNGALWATTTQTDIKIHFRGTQESALNVGIRIVIG
ncbi:MAG TPA: hypothetical protein VGQ53_17945 [Chitinophagaceae bacterium]|jgi:hypothetical protein|nr:hypothetical protein [Chitinophagaceae bacterium]